MKQKKIDYFICIPLLCLWFAHIYMSYKALYLKHHTPLKVNTIQLKNYLNTTDNSRNDYTLYVARVLNNKNHSRNAIENPVGLIKKPRQKQIIN